MKKLILITAIISLMSASSYSATYRIVHGTVCAMGGNLNGVFSNGGAVGYACCENGCTAASGPQPDGSPPPGGGCAPGGTNNQMGGSNEVVGSSCQFSTDNSMAGPNTSKRGLRHFKKR